MVLVVILIAAGVTTLSHVAPSRFLLDLAYDDVAVWRMPQCGQKTIYLTFDDGPNPGVTPALLDLLRRKEIRVTFFLIDEHLNEATAPIVARMFEEGHAVAQHSGNRWLLLRSSDALSAELRAAADRMQVLTGHRPCRLFRPHAGWRSITMMRGLRRSGYKLVGWSWMTWDWIWFRKRTGPRVAAHLISHAGPGKIIIIHDGHHRDPNADRQYAIEATARVVDSLLAQGYEFRSYAMLSMTTECGAAIQVCKTYRQKIVLATHGFPPYGAWNCKSGPVFGRIAYRSNQQACFWMARTGSVSVQSS